MTRAGVAAVVALLAAAAPTQPRVLECNAVRAKGCTPTSSLVHPQGVAVAPGGRDVYVVGYARGVSALTTLRFDGRLRPRGCVADGSRAPRDCRYAPLGAVAIAVVVSPDGRNVYTASFAGNRISEFARDRSGALRFIGSIRPAGVEAPTALAVSSDGRNVYVTSFRGDGVAWLRRTGGRLVRGGCVSSSGRLGCHRGRALRGALGLAVAADGLRVYVAARGSSALTVFARGRSGSIAQLPGSRGCMSSADVRGCAHVRGLRGASNVALADRAVWVTSETDGAVAVLREVAGGWRETGCLAASPISGCGRADGLARAVAVVPSANGALAVVASEGGPHLGSGGVAVVRRSASGHLAQDRGSCLRPTPSRCATAPTIAGANSLAVLSNGNIVAGAQEAQALLRLAVPSP